MKVDFSAALQGVGHFHFPKELENSQAELFWTAQLRVYDSIKAQGRVHVT